jgi:hypothetical protein
VLSAHQCTVYLPHVYMGGWYWSVTLTPRQPKPLKVQRDTNRPKMSLGKKPAAPKIVRVTQCTRWTKNPIIYGCRWWCG